MAVTTFVLESTWAEDWDGAASGESWSDEEAENALTWLTNIGSGAASGAATGAVAGPWGALIGGLVGGGLGAAQTAIQQNQQAQQPAPRPPAPAARPAPAPAPAPRPTAPPPGVAPAPNRTIAVPRPAPARPAPAAPATGTVSTSDVATLVTTLAPLLLALGQQLGNQPAAPTAPESWDWTEDSDPWPVGEDADPWPTAEAYDAPVEPLDTSVEAAPEAHPASTGETVPEAYEQLETDPYDEAASESDSEAECWPAESEWQEVPA